MIEPIGDEGDWPGDYRFLLGGAFLVAPVIDATGARDVTLPDGASYYDLFTPSADAIDGGTTLTDVDVSDASRIPVFVRQGAIVPMNVADDVTGFGTTASEGALTVLVYPSLSATSFSVVEDDASVTTITAQGDAAGGADISLSRALTTTLLRVRADLASTAVTVGGRDLPDQVDRAAFDAASEGWFYDAPTRSTWVKLPSAADPVEIRVD
jgi:alpha-D-xyloside xylohydrolase